MKYEINKNKLTWHRYFFIFRRLKKNFSYFFIDSSFMSNWGFIWINNNIKYQKQFQKKNKHSKWVSLLKNLYINEKQCLHSLWISPMNREGVYFMKTSTQIFCCHVWFHCEVSMVISFITSCPQGFLLFNLICLYIEKVEECSWPVHLISSKA